MQTAAKLLDRTDSKALKFIRLNPSCGRDELGNALSISYPTVIRTLSDLNNRKFIDNKTLQISADNHLCFWGISFGTSHIKVCLIDFLYNLIDSSIYKPFFSSSAYEPFQLNSSDHYEKDPEKIKDKYLCFKTPDTYDGFITIFNLLFVSILAFVKEQNEQSEFKTSGIGVTFSGAVDTSKLLLKKALGIKYLQDVSLNQIIPPAIHNELCERNIPLVFDHNAKSAAVAEKEALYHREIPPYKRNDLTGSHSKNLLCFFLGTGIGAGFVLDNRLHSGSRNFSGEVSHFPVLPSFLFLESCPTECHAHLESFIINDSDLNCSCGNHYCFEMYIKLFDRYLRKLKEARNRNPDISNLYPTTREKYSNMSDDDRIIWKGIEQTECNSPVDAENFLKNKTESAYRFLGHFIGYVITSIVNLLNIDTVVCTGRLAQYFEHIERYILEETGKNGVAYTRICCTILDSVHEKLSPTVGIAIQACYAFLGENLDWNI